MFLGVLVALLDQPFGQAAFLAGFMFLVYIPMGFYMDSFIYRLRQRRKQQRESAES